MSKDRLASKCGRSQAAHEGKAWKGKSWGWNELKHWRTSTERGTYPPRAE